MKYIGKFFALKSSEFGILTSNNQDKFANSETTC